MQTETSAPRTAGAATAQPSSRSNGRFWIRADDESKFSMDRVCTLQHNFHEHPLMQLDRLAELAKSLPAGRCRFIKPGTTQKSNFDHDSQSHDGRDLDEVFRRIEEPKSWIALYNVETDPAYAGFLNEALGTVRHLIDREQPGMNNAQGFIFISAPPSVTPFHIDRENNFWLQIRGRKLMNVWEASDRETVKGKDVESFIVNRSLDGVKLQDEMKGRSHELDCGPGDGVYFPSTAPHMTSSDTSWVKPGDGVSISIGIVFYTDVTKRHANIHALNAVLRRLGANPSHPGTSAFDGLKYPLSRAVVSMRKKFRGYSPPTGF